MTEEGLIKKLIMDWLRAQPRTYVRGIHIGSVGGRTNHSKGIADILGVWRGYPLAIEVKAKGGRVSPEQREFLDCWERAGGISILAHSLEDVTNRLDSSQKEGKDDYSRRISEGSRG